MLNVWVDGGYLHMPTMEWLKPQPCHEIFEKWQNVFTWHEFSCDNPTSQHYHVMTTIAWNLMESCLYFPFYLNCFRYYFQHHFFNHNILTYFSDQKQHRYQKQTSLTPYMKRCHLQASVLCIKQDNTWNQMWFHIN